MRHELPTPVEAGYDPRQDPADFDPRSYIAGIPEGQPLPAPGTPEHKYSSNRLKDFLGVSVKRLADEIKGKSLDELTPAQRSYAEQLSLYMEPVEYKGNRYYGNVLYNSHALSEGKPHYLHASDSADAVYTLGRHVRGLREQAEEAKEAEHRKANDDLKRKLEIDALLEAQNARTAADAARKAEEAAKAKAAATPPLTPQEKKERSTNALQAILRYVEGFTDENGAKRKFNNKDLAASDATLRGELDDEDVHRLELYLTDYLDRNPATNKDNAVAILKSRVDQWGNTSELKAEKAQMYNRFAKIGREVEERLEARQANIEAYTKYRPDLGYEPKAKPGEPIRTESMEALAKYMTQAYRDRLNGKEPKTKKRAQEQLESLLPKISKDNPALRAFLDSDLPANAKVRTIATELLEANEAFLRKWNNGVHREHDLNNYFKGIDPRTKEESVTHSITKELTKDQEPFPPKHRGIATYRGVMGKLMSKERRALYNELYDNEVMGMEHEQFIPREADFIPMTPARQKVIDYFNSPNQGDTLTSKKGGLSDRFVRYAQLNALAKEVKGDRPAEHELRARGINVKAGRRGHERGAVGKGIRRIARKITRR